MQGKEAKMSKTVSFLTVSVVGAAMAMGCAVETEDPSSPEVTVDEGALDETVIVSKQAYCGVGQSGAIAAQRAATAFYQFLTAGNLAGVGNVATAADKAAYAQAGGLGTLGATTFTAFYPPPGGVQYNELTLAKNANNAVAALKSMVDSGSLFLSEAAPGSICQLKASVRGVYGQGNVSAATVQNYVTQFVENALLLDYPQALPEFLAIESSGTGSTSGGTGTSGGPGPIGGTSSGGTPPVIRPLFLIDPEPARLYQNLTGSNGATGMATYVNSGAGTTAYRWTTSPALGTVPAGAPCSPAEIVAGTEIYRAIQVYANGTRRCY